MSSDPQEVFSLLGVGVGSDGLDSLDLEKVLFIFHGCG